MLVQFVFDGCCVVDWDTDEGLLWVGVGMNAMQVGARLCR